MYKGGGYEDSSSEMAREEDELMRYREMRIFSSDDRKGACYILQLGTAQRRLE